MRGIKNLNDYSKLITFYETIPKSVLAAIAVSFAGLGAGKLENVSELILKEWEVLYQNGIVPQKPKTN